MNKIAITGATGFIGKHLLAELFSGASIEFSEVYCFSRQKNPEIGAQYQINMIQADLKSLSESHHRILEDCQYVFHLAANPSVDSGLRGYSDNVESTKALLSVLATSNNLKRFIFVSSIGAVDRQSCAPEMRALSEATPPNPQSLYGKSKLECENMLKASSLPYTIVRPAWVYGKGMRENTHLKVLYSLALKSSVLARINYPGRVSLTRVELLAKFLLYCANSNEAENQTFFCSTSAPISIGEILLQMQRNLHGDLKPQLNIPWWVTVFLLKFRTFLPLKVKILLCDYLLCSSAKAEDLAPSILSPLDAKTEISGLTRNISRERNIFKDSATFSYVVVSGAASGIGRALSKILHSRGYTPILLDRNKNALELLTQEFEDSPIWHADLESPVERNRVCEKIKNFEGELIGVVNCAGRGLKVPFHESSLTDQKSLISINIDALVELSHAACTRFATKGSTNCFIVNISSSSAFQPLPYFAIYSATKAFVLQFSQSLVGEYQDSATRVLTIAPGGTSTRFQESAGVATSPNESLLSPSFVAEQICNAIEDKRHGLVVIGRRAQAMELLGRILGPQLSVKLWRKLVMKMR